MKRFIYFDYHIENKNQQGHYLPMAEAILTAVSRHNVDCYLVASQKLKYYELENVKILPRYRADGLQNALNLYGRLVKKIKFLLKLKKVLKKIVKLVYKKYRVYSDTTIINSDTFYIDTLQIFEGLDINADDVLFFSSLKLTDAKCIIELLKTTYGKQKPPMCFVFLFVLNANSLDCEYANNTSDISEFQGVIRSIRSTQVAESIVACSGDPCHSLYVDFICMNDLKLLQVPTMNFGKVNKINFAGSSVSTMLNVMSMGVPRVDKGFQYIPEIIEKTMRYTSKGNYKFIIQVGTDDYTIRDFKNFTQYLARLENFPPSKVEMVSEQLDNQEYYNLFTKGDIFLIPYQHSLYFNCSSGVFSEAMWEGKPVLVKNSTAMASILKEEQYNYLRNQLKTTAVVKSQSYGDLYVLDGKTSEKAAKFTSEEPGNYIFVNFKMQTVKNRNRPDFYVKVIVDFLDNSGALIKSTYRVAENSLEGGEIIMLKTPQDFARAAISLENAYTQYDLIVENLEVYLSQEQDIRLGVIGLAFDEVEEAPELLEEMILHYEHYLKTAQEYSKKWRKDNDFNDFAERIVGEM